jgi:hypothetical protein
LNLILNTVVFFFISLAYFYSLTGYGKLLIENNFSINNKNNFFELPIFGLIIKIIIGFVIYIFIGTNFLINVFLFIFGLFLYFFYKKEFNNIKFYYVILLLITVFSVLIISKTHEDFNYYHYFSVHEVFNNNLRIGISKLNERFFHSSLLIYEQSLLILPYFNFQLIHLSVFFIYLSVLGYFLNILIIHKNKSEEFFYSIICVMILLIKFNRLSEFGYDYISQFLLLIVFHKIYFLIEEKKELISSILIFFLSILIKPVSLLFSPIMIFLLIKHKLGFNLRLFFSRKIIFLSLLFILISSSFFRTGCIFYPLNSTCFSKEIIFWSEKVRIKNYSEYVSLWAKAYYVDVDSKYEKILDKTVFKKNFNWVKYWVDKHFFYKISEFLLIFIFLIFLSYIYFTREKSNKVRFIKDKIFLIILSSSSIFLWFIIVPQFRFGFSAMIIFSYLVFRLFLNQKILFNKKKIINLFIFSILILNIKNFNRIDSEFKRDDFYKFKNFPYYNEIKIDNNYSGINRSKFLNIDVLK